ncbi:hypothetical protein KKG81_03370, partial [bacterium]|nr:hypothetical protein [bacterium]
KEKVTKKYKNVLNALNINLDDFYEIIETRFEDLSYILYSFIDDNNLSEDDNISTYYKKRVSSILSCQEHYLTFIYNINISEVDNKKVFLLFANALKDGIIVETILLLINRRKIKYNVLNSEVDKYLVDLIIEMKSKFTNSFKHLPILFISHYIGLSENQSRNFANDINLSYKISKGKKVGKETVNNIVYKSYFFDLKKTIIKIKLLGIYEFKCVSKDT